MTTTQITYFDSFSDGSGACMNINCMGLRWSFQMLGVVKANRIDGRQFIKRGIIKASLAIATKIFESKVAELGSDWLALNKAMYAEVA